MDIENELQKPNWIGDFAHFLFHFRLSFNVLSLIMVSPCVCVSAFVGHFAQKLWSHYFRNFQSKSVYYTYCCLMRSCWMCVIRRKRFNILYSEENEEHRSHSRICVGCACVDCRWQNTFFIVNVICYVCHLYPYLYIHNYTVRKFFARTDTNALCHHSELYIVTKVAPSSISTLAKFERRGISVQKICALCSV